MQTNSSHLVIGMGQIGTAMFKVLREKYSVYGIDRVDLSSGESEISEGSSFDVLHVSFPYSDKFVSEVERYKRMFGKPGALVIIHSTVPVGTTEQIDNAVHSPVRGIHPELVGGIKTFVKFFGGLRSDEAADIFRPLSIECSTSKNAKDTEAMKLWDTTIYGVNIALEKIIHEYCEANGLNFDIVYTQSCASYNDGYEKLGFPQYKKYVLDHVPGKIGGHCVLQNLPLLGNEKVKNFILNKD